MIGATDVDSGQGVVEAQPLSAEERRLRKLFDDLESGQLEVIDAAGRRVIELTSLLVGLFFAALAAGSAFPPPFLTGNVVAQSMGMATLALFLGAILFGLRTVQPRAYRVSSHNLSALRRELDGIVSSKSRSLRIAGWLFFLGCAALVGLIGMVIVGS